MYRSRIAVGYTSPNANLRVRFINHKETKDILEIYRYKFVGML